MKYQKLMERGIFWDSKASKMIFSQGDGAMTPGARLLDLFCGAGGAGMGYA